LNDVPQLELLDADGSTLRFAITGSTEHEVNYVITIDVGWARASAKVSTYLYGPPTQFFKSLAESWRGWEGEKTWEDLEHRVGLTATCDRTGHVTLKVMVQDSQYSGRATLPIYLEAGGLEAVAKRVESWFTQALPNTSFERTREG
jgi:hypothetical protein